MTAAEFLAIRRRMRLSQIELGRLLGYTGNKNTVHQVMQRYETGRKTIPLYLARYLWLIDRVYAKEIPVNGSGFPLWPQWPAYLDEAEPV